MPNRTPSQLPLPSETSHITRRRPSEPLPVTTERSQHYTPQHTCNSPNCAAQEVFSTPELLENTLNYLPTKDILSLRHVSKTWHSLINTSPSLRLHLFLEPQWNRPAIDFRLLPCTTILGLQIRRREPVHLGQWIEATMTPAAARSISRKIYKRPPPKKHTVRRGRRVPSPVEEVEDSDTNQQQQGPLSSSHLTPHQVADLHLTQPPLVGVQASVVLVRREQQQQQQQQQHPQDSDQANNNNNNIPVILKTSPSHTARGHVPIRQEEDIVLDPAINSPLARSKLACDAGITLGFMAEAVNFMLRDLESPVGGSNDAEGGRQGQEQEQEVVVVFRAIVSFCARTDGAPRKRGKTRYVTKVE